MIISFSIVDSVVRGSTVLVSRSVVVSCVAIVVVVVVVSIATSSMELRIGRSVVVSGTVTASFVVRSRKDGGGDDEMSGVEMLLLFLFLVYLVLAYTSLFTCPIGVFNTFILVIFSASPSSLTAFLDLEDKLLLG